MQKELKSITSFRFKKSELGAFQDVKQLSGLFKKGCRIGGLTDGSFSLIDLIKGLINKTGKANLCVVTWSAGIKDAHNIAWMKDSDIISTFTLVTDNSYKTRQPRYALSIEDAFGLDCIRTSEIHAKFTLIWNEDFNVIIRTSMNLNANKTIETFEIDEDKEVFSFYHSFVEHLLNNQKPGFLSASGTVNRSVATYFAKTVKANSTWSDL